MWHDKVSNVYFHLNLGCLNKFDPTLNAEEITMTNEMFYSISDVHFKHLALLGILKHIIGNKGKDMQVSTQTNCFFFPIKNFTRKGAG